MILTPQDQIKIILDKIIALTEKVDRIQDLIEKDFNTCYICNVCCDNKYLRSDDSDEYTFCSEKCRDEYHKEIEGLIEDFESKFVDN